MAEKSIEEKVKDIIVEQLGVNPEQVTPQASFIEDLGANARAARDVREMKTRLRPCFRV